MFTLSERNRWRPDLLLQPAFLLGLALLLLNDFVLKTAWSNAFTGKLSDFAGLFIFPLFWVAIFPKNKNFIFALTALGFIWWKSPLSQGFIDFWNSNAPYAIGRVVDYLDLLALTALLPAYALTQGRQTSARLRLHPVFPLALAFFAFAATSKSPYYSVKMNKQYEVPVAASQLLETVDALDEVSASGKNEKSKLPRTIYINTPGLNDEVKYLIFTVKVSATATGTAKLEVENCNAYRGGIYGYGILTEKAETAFETHVLNPLRNLPPNFLETSKKIDALMAQMTLQEKIGQLNLYTTDWGATGPTIREGYANDVRAGNCGALFNSHTTTFTRELQRIAVEESRLKIPLIFGYDVIHGYKTIFPIPLGEAASWDLNAIETSAHIAAKEAAASGLHWTFAPMVDLGRDARWGRVMEGAGEDTWLGCRIAEARVRGFQGKQIGATDRVVACVKHYAGYGASQAGRDYNTVDMSERFFREYYLPPYRAAVKAGARTVMTSFNDYDGVPASGNSYLLRNILRQEMGFNGFVVTDYTSINEMVMHGVVADEKEAAELAFNAGVDMDMQSSGFARFLAESLKAGNVKQADIDVAVRRILRIKYELGLFDDPYRFCNAERERTVVFSAEHRQAAREISRKSVVLLKNDKNALPLNKSTKIALIGPLADNQSELIGNWSGAGDAKDCVSLLQGLRNAGANVEHAKGCEFEGNDKSGFSAALALAQRSDVVVLAIGERAMMSGEAASRVDISIPGVQEDLLEALAATGKPVVVVLMNGRPLAIPRTAKAASAILEAWWLGTESGNALADIIFGAYNPSGKLPMSFPHHVGQVPLFYNEKSTGRPFDPNSKWTSKYIDFPNEPLYPFGYGLSYTTFNIGAPKTDKAGYMVGEKLSISVQVQNSGTRAGEEVVQLYIRDLVGSVTRPVRELRNYQKVMLLPGESKTLTFTLSEEDLSFFRRDMSFGMEPGEFDIMVGPDSRNVQKVRVKFEEKRP